MTKRPRPKANPPPGPLSDAERARRYREQLRGGPAREPTVPACGSWAAVLRHERRGEALDDRCREAKRAHNAAQYQRRKGQ